ncbi:MAG: glutathione S-transferase N-terminal domain-containing protein [Candidatus Omnitrophica bacterium]|nr:glutathione S-transferase N-terminal domain-containing protein [Candidatus Omnitrophota bacterium]
MQDLKLYYMPTCPYCKKVLTYMELNKIQIPLKDTLENSAHRKELLEIGGKTQVPCLVIDGKALYESDDIIKWLKDNWRRTW